LLEKYCLSAFIVTGKLGLAVELGFFQLLVHGVILYCRSLPTDVYFENYYHLPNPAWCDIDFVNA